jgi:hypothetical protein
VTSRLGTGMSLRFCYGTYLFLKVEGVDIHFPFFSKKFLVFLLIKLFTLRKNTYHTSVRIAALYIVHSEYMYSYCRRKCLLFRGFSCMTLLYTVRGSKGPTPDIWCLGMGDYEKILGPCVNTSNFVGRPECRKGQTRR